MKKDIIIRLYEKTDEDALFILIEREGDEWKEYWGEPGRKKYQKALQNSISYLIFEDGKLCGYARCRDDDGFGVYVYDLLVDKEYRGKEYGRLLMEKVCSDNPGAIVYVMSGVDPYYSRLGYKKEGTIFIVKPK